jgi:hypothetical protein
MDHIVHGIGVAAQIGKRSGILEIATGEALNGDSGKLLIEGETGNVYQKSDICAYVGTAPELFAGDASALHNFLDAFSSGHKYDDEAFSNRKDFLPGAT